MVDNNNFITSLNCSSIKRAYKITHTMDGFFFTIYGNDFS